jgi:hypothetical protein
MVATCPPSHDELGVAGKEGPLALLPPGLALIRHPIERTEQRLKAEMSRPWTADDDCIRERHRQPQALNFMR